MGERAHRARKAIAGRWRLLLHRIAIDLDEEQRADASGVSDAELVDYREKRLSPSDAARIERALGASRALRQRIATLSGVDRPSAELESKLFDHQGRRQRTLRRVGLAAMAASLLIGGLMLGLLIAPREPEMARVISADSFEVRISGLAERRAVREDNRALATTRVKIDILPRRKRLEAIEFAIYRTDGKELVRLSESQGLRTEIEAGAAHLEIPAAELVGSELGTRSFVIAVGPADQLPERVSITDLDEPEGAFVDLPSILATRHELTIIQDPFSTQPPYQP